MNLRLLCIQQIYCEETSLFSSYFKAFVLFSPVVSRWVGVQAGGLVDVRREKVCSGCISETVRCRKLILGRDIGWVL